ncbi:hypothetical protein Tco_1211035 [Tanacetum coccineum]
MSFLTSIYSLGNIMDEVDIEDLTIEQHLRLTQENQTPKKIEDMTIAEYVEYEKKMSENHISAESDCDLEDMEEEVEYMTNDEVVVSEQKKSNHGNTQNIQHFEEKDDVDKWLNAKITKHLSIQGVENTEDALINIIKSIKKEMKDDIMKKQIEALTTNIDNETSSIASSEVDTCDDNTSHTASCLLPKELSPGSFLLPFNIDDHNLYAITTLEAKDNIMPLDVYEYLGLDKLRDAGTFEQRSRAYGTPNPHDEIAKPISFSPDRRGLVKRWHVCKPINVTYDNENSKDCGMWPTCDPDSKVCFGYNEVRYGQQKIDDTIRERRYYEWEYLEQEENEQLPIRLRLCNYSFEEWLKIRIGHNNLHESDCEFIFNEWILDSYDVEEKYAREIGDPYSRRFDKYNRVLKNEIEHLSNEYILRIGKKGYVLDDVWEKCQQNY